MERYFIIEHPTRGILKDLGETEGGRVGRFSAFANRDEREKIECYFTITQAEEARAKITPAKTRGECQIRSSKPVKREGFRFDEHWPVVS